MGKRYFPLINSRQRVPWHLIEEHSDRCVKNHSQTPVELASRGGLSMCEAVAVLEDRPWKEMTDTAAMDTLAAILLSPPAQKGSGGE